MAEMKNICGKIPMDLHEKVREEIELTESSTQKFLQQVIEEHFNRLEGKGEISMGAVRTVAVQVTEDLFSRLKAVLARNGMKQKDFLIGLSKMQSKKKKPNGKQSQRKPKKQKWKILRLRNQNRMKSQQNLKQKSLRQKHWKLKQTEK